LQAPAAPAKSVSRHDARAKAETTYYARPDIPVFLLDVVAKSDKIDLSLTERNDLSGLADHYRDGVHCHIQG
jgi:hypothetical protein